MHSFDSLSMYTVSCLSSYFHIHSSGTNLLTISTIPRPLYRIFNMIQMFLFVILFFKVSSDPILITCHESCGCVTETGINVTCPSVNSKQTAVLRAEDKFKPDFFPVYRMVKIGTTRSFSTIREYQLESNCPMATGTTTFGKFKMCFKRNGDELPLGLNASDESNNSTGGKYDIYDEEIAKNVGSDNCRVPKTRWA